MKVTPDPVAHLPHADVLPRKQLAQIDLLPFVADPAAVRDGEVSTSLRATLGNILQKFPVGQTLGGVRFPFSSPRLRLVESNVLLCGGDHRGELTGNASQT